MIVDGPILQVNRRKMKYQSTSPKRQNAPPCSNVGVVGGPRDVIRLESFWRVGHGHICIARSVCLALIDFREVFISLGRDLKNHFTSFVNIDG